MELDHSRSDDHCGHSAVEPETRVRSHPLTVANDVSRLQSRKEHADDNQASGPAQKILD